VAHLPDPQLYDNWKKYARRLVETLESLLPTRNNTPKLPRFGVGDLPSAAEDGLLIFVTDEAGGAVPAFSLSGQWRRVTDRAVVS